MKKKKKKKKKNKLTGRGSWAGYKKKLLKPGDRASVWLCGRIGQRQWKNDREKTWDSRERMREREVWTREIKSSDVNRSQRNYQIL